MKLDRTLVAQTAPDGGGIFQPQFTSDTSHKTRQLIRRELRNGSIQWFDTFPRDPRPDELIDPRAAAALQLGYLTHEAALGPGIAFNYVQVILGYLVDEISSPASHEFQAVLARWQDGDDFWLSRHHYKLTGAADGLLAADSDLRIQYDIGTLIGDAAIDRASKAPHGEYIAPGSFDGFLDLIADLENCTSPSQREGRVRAMSESIRVSQLLSHVLAPWDSPEAFVGETISSLEAYDTEWNKSREDMLQPTYIKAVPTKLPEVAKVRGDAASAQQAGPQSSAVVVPPEGVIHSSLPGGKSARDLGDSIPAEKLRQLRAIKRRVDPNDKYVGDSLAILRVFEKIEEYNRLPDSPVLILGESGVGKTEIAELIHKSSARRGKRFVRAQATDFMGVDENISKSKVVGYGRNPAVAGASPKGGKGLLQEAEGGTLFIDEAGKLPRWFQTYLHQVLDRLPIQLAFGEGEPYTPDVRLILAAYDFQERIDEKEIASDFLRRLHNYQIVIPPLRERRDDVLRFVQKWCDGFRWTAGFLGCLLKHDWPGNVGELRDVLKLATARCSGKEIQGAERKPDKSSDQAHTPGKRKAKRASLPKLTAEHLGEKLQPLVASMHPAELESVAYRFLVDILQQTGLRKSTGLQKELAKVLGVSQATVCRDLPKYNIRLI